MTDDHCVTGKTLNAIREEYSERVNFYFSLHRVDDARIIQQKKEKAPKYSLLNKWITGSRCDTTLIILVPTQVNVTLHTP